MTLIIISEDMHPKMALRWAHALSCKLILLITGVLLILPYLITKQALHLCSLRDNSPHVTSVANQHMGSLLGVLPYSVWSALAVQSKTGYLLGNGSGLSFHAYPADVDLRIIVIVFDRYWSLEKCLDSLERADYMGSRVSLHVWIDRENATGNVPRRTYRVATAFQFTHGNYHVHVQKAHVGIQGQWTNTWRPRVGTAEVGLILEDDMTVSPFYWRWLSAAARSFSNRPDVSGVGLSHPGIAHKTGMYLDIPLDYDMYLYKVICTWGFAPLSTNWRRYQDWFYESEQNSSFEPLVADILPTQWYLGEKKIGRQRNLWELWHIYYTHNARPPQYNLLLNTLHEGLLAVNRHETGLHDEGTGVPTEPLCLEWRTAYVNFTAKLPKFGYDGQLES